MESNVNPLLILSPDDLVSIVRGTDKFHVDVGDGFANRVDGHFCRWRGERGSPKVDTKSTY